MEAACTHARFHTAARLIASPWCQPHIMALIAWTAQPVHGQALAACHTRHITQSHGTHSLLFLQLLLEGLSNFLKVFSSFGYSRDF